MKSNLASTRITFEDELKRLKKLEASWHREDVKYAHRYEWSSKIKEQLALLDYDSDVKAELKKRGLTSFRRRQVLEQLMDDGLVVELKREAIWLKESCRALAALIGEQIMRSSELHDKLREQGFSDGTIRLARKRLDIVARRAQSGRWYVMTYNVFVRQWRDYESSH